jgi:hypothetical protein
MATMFAVVVGNGLSKQAACQADLFWCVQVQHELQMSTTPQMREQSERLTLTGDA